MYNEVMFKLGEKILIIEGSLTGKQGIVIGVVDKLVDVQVDGEIHTFSFSDVRTVPKIGYYLVDDVSTMIGGYKTKKEAIDELARLVSYENELTIPVVYFDGKRLDVIKDEKGNIINGAWIKENYENFK